MSDGSDQRQSQPAVPVLGEHLDGEILAAAPDRGQWRYRPRRVGMLWRSRTLRVVVVFTVLALCGLVILALVRDQTGTQGFLVGLGLAVLPVPVLMTAFRWLDRVEPGPWRNMLFAFAWGACAAALVAIIANSFATQWIATATADPGSADTLGATVIAPVVEESAKAAAVLLLFLFRRREFGGIVDGMVVAGFTATGFAFTENILYLGNAFGEDRMMGSGFASVTAATFFVRVVMTPFAHPLFTVLTGIGFGIAASSARPQRARRIVFPLLGLVLAMGMHALWNGSSAFGPYGFYAVYGAFMVPAFGLVTWLAIWARLRELRTLGTELPVYAAALLAVLRRTSRPLLDAGPRHGQEHRTQARGSGGRMARTAGPTARRTTRHTLPHTPPLTPRTPTYRPQRGRRARPAAGRRPARSPSTSRSRPRSPFCADRPAAARRAPTSPNASGSCCTTCGSAGRPQAPPSGTRRRPRADCAPGSCPRCTGRTQDRSSGRAPGRATGRIHPTAATPRTRTPHTRTPDSPTAHRRTRRAPTLRTTGRATESRIRAPSNGSGHVRPRRKLR